MVKYDSELGESRQENCSFSTFIKIGVRADRKIVALVLLSKLEEDQTEQGMLYFATNERIKCTNFD